MEVYGKEWSYGYCENGTGVGWCTPKEHPQHEFRETVVMGETELSTGQVESLIQELKNSDDWQGSNYDIMRFNCCTFAEVLVNDKLKVGPFPAWVNRLARTGSVVINTAVAVASKAKEIDEKLHVSNTIARGYAAAERSMTSVDNNLGLSQRALAVDASIRGMTSQLSAKLKLDEGAKKVGLTMNGYLFKGFNAVGLTSIANTLTVDPEQKDTNTGTRTSTAEAKTIEKKTNNATQDNGFHNVALV